MTRTTPDKTITAEIAMPMDVTLEPDASRWTLVLRRRFRHSPDRLWRMITEPDRLARWSPIVPDRPLTAPGPATCRENPGDEPRDAEVIRVDPPRQLVHRWGSDLLRWTVIPETGGTTLELRQTFDDRSVASMYAAGWRVCFGTLAATHDGVDRERIVGMAAMDYGWQGLNDRYAAAFGDA